MKTRFEYDKQNIGAKLRYYRKKKNLTAEEVREYLNIGSVQAIYKWENGITMPAVDNFLALMELYEIKSFEMLLKKIPVFDPETLFFVECHESKRTFCVYSMI